MKPCKRGNLIKINGSRFNLRWIWNCFFIELRLILLEVENKDLRFLLTLFFFIASAIHTSFSPLSRLFSIQEKREKAIKLSFCNNKSPWKWFAKFQIPSQLKEKTCLMHIKIIGREKSMRNEWKKFSLLFFCWDFSLFMSVIKVSREEN